MRQRAGPLLARKRARLGKVKFECDRMDSNLPRVIRRWPPVRPARDSAPNRSAVLPPTCQSSVPGSAGRPAAKAPSGVQGPYAENTPGTCPWPPAEWVRDCPPIRLYRRPNDRIPCPQSAAKLSKPVPPALHRQTRLCRPETWPVPLRGWGDAPSDVTPTLCSAQRCQARQVITQPLV